MELIEKTLERAWNFLEPAEAPWNVTYILWNASKMPRKSLGPPETPKTSWN